MTFTDKDIFSLFKSRVNCAVSRIRARKMRISTSKYKVWAPGGICTLYNDFSAHPLSVLLEGRKVRPNSSVDVPSLVAGLMKCDRRCIYAFNYGLKGSQLYPVDPRVLPYYKKYYDFGLSIRAQSQNKTFDEALNELKERMDAIF